MLQEEVLQPNDDGLYEEPEGELLEVVNYTSRSLTVLTRVDTEKVPVVDPGDYTVAELKEELTGRNLDDDDLEALEIAEMEGKERKSALQAIRSCE